MLLDLADHTHPHTLTPTQDFGRGTLTSPIVIDSGSSGEEPEQEEEEFEMRVESSSEDEVSGLSTVSSLSVAPLTG